MEARVVEVENVREGGGGAVVEVGSASSQTSQDGALEFADVGALAGDHRAADVGDLRDHAGGVAQHRDQGQVRSAARRIHEADVQRRGPRVIANVWRIVARTARAVDGIGFQNIVQAGDASDGDGQAVEKVLPASDGATCLRMLLVVTVDNVRPLVVEREDRR
jgi:hypothetical protein